jgi:serine/threonine protein kinase
MDLDVTDIDSDTVVECPKCHTKGSVPDLTVVQKTTVQTVPAQAAQSLKIGVYKIEKEIGSGGMGKVYKAYDENLERTVAIKFLGADLVEDKDFIKRFEREAKAMARINHSNVTQIYGIGEEQGVPYFVMEYIEGESLDKIFDKTSLPLNRAIDIILQVAEGLKVAHLKGIIHRDVKPANIFITSSDQIKIGDFGLAKTKEEHKTGEASLTGVGTALGTPHYISPEQAVGEAVDFRADIYSLGVTFFRMLTGRVPYNAATPMSVIVKHINDPIPDIKQILPSLPEQIAVIIKKMMAKKPEGRHQSYNELIKDLNAYRYKLFSPAIPRRRGKILKRIFYIIILLLIANLIKVHKQKIKKRFFEIISKNRRVEDRAVPKDESNFGDRLIEDKLFPKDEAIIEDRPIDDKPVPKDKTIIKDKPVSVDTPNIKLSRREIITELSKRIRKARKLTHDYLYSQALMEYKDILKDTNGIYKEYDKEEMSDKRKWLLEYFIQSLPHQSELISVLRDFTPGIIKNLQEEKPYVSLKLKNGKKLGGKIEAINEEWIYFRNSEKVLLKRIKPVSLYELMRNSGLRSDVFRHLYLAVFCAVHNLDDYAKEELRKAHFLKKNYPDKLKDIDHVMSLVKKTLRFRRITKDRRRRPEKEKRDKLFPF